MKVNETLECPLCGEVVDKQEIEIWKGEKLRFRRDRCEACVAETGCSDLISWEAEPEHPCSGFVFGGKLG